MSAAGNPTSRSTPREIVGIYWYAAEKLDAPTRETVKPRLADHRVGAACPFLVDHACAIHPVRPVACRQYNVFTTPCAPGEDPYYSRRSDVLVPLADYTDRAFTAVIPFYQLNEKDPHKAVRLIRDQIMNLQKFGWRKLLEVLEPGTKT